MPNLDRTGPYGQGPMTGRFKRGMIPPAPAGTPTRPPGLASPPAYEPPQPVKEMADMVNQIIEGFRMFRQSWKGTTEWATEGRPEMTRENVRQAWGEFLDMLRDSFDKFEQRF